VSARRRRLAWWRNCDELGHVFEQVRPDTITRRCVHCREEDRTFVHLEWIVKAGHLVWLGPNVDSARLVQWKNNRRKFLIEHGESLTK